ncbi:MAG: single-stranded DNA-binding protein [Thermodesulfovibrionales bacterium]|nr:single-stranded DNA-binding protein [Thermodesulfovibrionales bacterium]
MFNKVIMVGNLTADPELRYTAQGTPVANLRIAINSKYRSGEEFKEETLFIDVTVWGKQGESCSQYLSKGRQVLVEGRLQERSWESDGQKRSKMEIVANNVKFLGRRDEGGGGGSGGSYSGSAPQEASDVEPF